MKFNVTDTFHYLGGLEVSKVVSRSKGHCVNY